MDTDCDNLSVDQGNVDPSVTKKVSKASSVFSNLSVNPVKHHVSFHPSIWPKMVGKASPDAKPGDWVEVISKEGERFGWGLYNPKSNMPLRIVSHSTQDLEDGPFFERAIKRAAALRRETHSIDQHTNSYRAIQALTRLANETFANLLQIFINNIYPYRTPTPSTPHVGCCVTGLQIPPIQNLLSHLMARRMVYSNIYRCVGLPGLI